MDWLIENWDVLLEALAAVYGAANLIVALTPSPRDDAVLAEIRSHMVRFSLLQPHDSEGTLKFPGTPAGRTR